MSLNQRRRRKVRSLDWALPNTHAIINAWERGLPVAEHVKPRTARDARGLLCTMLGDAATRKPRPLIDFNPALRQRNRGKRTALSAKLS